MSLHFSFESGPDIPTCRDSGLNDRIGLISTLEDSHCPSFWLLPQLKAGAKHELIPAGIPHTSAAFRRGASQEMPVASSSQPRGKG